MHRNTLQHFYSTWRHVPLAHACERSCIGAELSGMEVRIPMRNYKSLRPTLFIWVTLLC